MAPSTVAPAINPVLVVCHLCVGRQRRWRRPRPGPDGRIVTIACRAWWAAMDHLLDHHRAALLANPDAAQRAFTVQDGATPVRALKPTDR